MRIAAVDVGSNSVLLLVQERLPTGWKTVFESTNVISLGAGVKESRMLSEAGMAATLVALQNAFREAKRLGAERVQARATMAARMANNSAEFLERARAQGTPVEILSGEEEAELGFHAVCDDPMFAGYPRLSIIDVGGQSTELVTADSVRGKWEIKFKRSYPIGTLALLGGPLSDPCPEGLAQLHACQMVDDVVGLCYRPGACGKIVCLGATRTNLISIRERLAEWTPDKVHGATLSYEEISKAVESLFSLTWEERSGLIGIEPGREQTLPIGALILERFLFALRAEDCAVSVRGWRHAFLELRMAAGGA